MRKTNPISWISSNRVQTGSVDSAMRSALVTVVLVGLGLAGCSTAQQTPVANPLTAAKTTCDELVIVDEPLGISLVDRVLVPYSRTILGVEATYEDDQGRTLTVVSGGYLDDITETYDELEPAGRIKLGDSNADLLEGLHLGVPIAVAYRLGSSPPCSTLAAVAIGFSTEEFVELSRAMTLREH